MGVGGGSVLTSQMKAGLPREQQGSVAASAGAAPQTNDPTHPTFLSSSPPPPPPPDPNPGPLAGGAGQQGVCLLPGERVRGPGAQLALLCSGQQGHPPEVRVKVKAVTSLAPVSPALCTCAQSGGGDWGGRKGGKGGKQPKTNNGVLVVSQGGAAAAAPFHLF